MQRIDPILAAALCGGALFLAQGAVAQEGAGRPRFQFLRQNEDWSGFRASTDADALDKLKHLDLSSDGDIWLSLGGRADARLESWDGFGFNAANRDEFVLTRALLHADLHVGDNLRFFAEGMTAQSTNRNLPGGARALDVDTLAVQQAFVDYTVEIGQDTLRFRAGRQMFLYGAQRLLGPLPWANTLRTWDGLSAQWKHGDWSIDGFATQFVPVRKTQYNRANDGLQLYGVYAKRKPAQGERGLDVYLLGNTREPVTINGTTGNERRHTAGARSYGPLTALGKGFDGEAEVAYQFGEVGSSQISAYSLTGVLGHRVNETTRVWLGLDYASGDGRPGGSVGTFHQLFPLGHAYFGLADTQGRQNVAAVQLGVSVKIAPRTTAKLVGHAFRLASRNDAVYNVGGAPAGTLSSRDIAQEVDLLVNHGLNARTKLYGGISYVIPGGGRGSGADSVSFFYLGAGWMF